jgi:cell division protease FtsH
VNFLLARTLVPSAEGPVTVPYTLFREEVGKGNVQAIYSRGETLTGGFKAPVTYGR